MATADKLTTIAENVPKVYHAGQMNVIENAECLKGSKSGSAFLLDDVSTITHEMGVKVRGKNLFDKDNYIIITGNQSYLAFDISKLIIGNKYTFSSNLPITWFKISNNIQGYNSVQLLNLAGFTTFTFTMQRNSSISSTATQYLFIGIDTSTKNVIRNISELDGYNIQIELGTTATSYTPYVPDLTAVTVSRYGKNLVTAQQVYSGCRDYQVITIDDKTAVRFIDSREFKWEGIHFAPNTQYTVSFDFKVTPSLATGTSTKSMLFCFFYDDNTTQPLVSDRSEDWLHITSTSRAGKTVVGLGIYAYNYVNYVYIDINSFQLEEGTSETEYEPYQAQTYIPTADGIVNGVTSLYPNTTLMTDTEGVIIDCEYYKDIDKAFNELSSAIALSGGE